MADQISDIHLHEDHDHDDHDEVAAAAAAGAMMRKRLMKQVLSCGETPRDAAWERRRRQMMRRAGGDEAAETLTDEDLSELRGCIELGFGFNEEDGGHALCDTLPALDLYFAITRQLSLSPASNPRGRPSTSSVASSSSSSLGRSSPTLCTSPKGDSEAWKICSPGEDPQQVKTKIRHWAQAVACSVMQSLLLEMP